MNEVVKQTTNPLNVSGGSKVVPLIPTTTDEFVRLAGLLFRSQMVPKQFDTAEKVLMAMMMGADVGFTPTQAISNIAVINGKASIFGDGLTAIARRAGNQLKEWSTGSVKDGDYTAHCKIIRADNGEEIERDFSIDDAIRAGLWQTEPVLTRYKKGGGSYEVKNDSPWYKYPKRMLMWRARGWAVRDGLSDQMYGLQVAEEVIDHEQSIKQTEEEAKAPSRLQARLNSMKNEAGPEDAEVEQAGDDISPAEGDTGLVLSSEPDAFEANLEKFCEYYGYGGQQFGTAETTERANPEIFFFNNITHFLYRNVKLGFMAEKAEAKYYRPALNDSGILCEFDLAVIEKFSEANDLTSEHRKDPEDVAPSQTETSSGFEAPLDNIKPKNLSEEAEDWLSFIEEDETTSEKILENWPIEQDLEWFVVLTEDEKEYVTNATEDRVELLDLSNG